MKQQKHVYLRLILVIVLLIAGFAGVYLYRTSFPRYAKSIYSQNTDALDKIVADYKENHLNEDVYQTETELDDGGHKKKFTLYAKSDSEGRAYVRITVKTRSLSKNEGTGKVENWYLVYEDEGFDIKHGEKYSDLSGGWAIWRYKGDIG